MRLDLVKELVEYCAEAGLKLSPSSSSEDILRGLYRLDQGNPNGRHAKWIRAWLQKASEDK
jgi:hypothetical protein